MTETPPETYFARETIWIECEVQIEYARGSEASRQDALRVAERDIRLGVFGASGNGCYGAKLVAAVIRR